MHIGCSSRFAGVDIRIYPREAEQSLWGSSSSAFPSISAYLSRSTYLSSYREAGTVVDAMVEEVVEADSVAWWGRSSRSAALHRPIIEVILLLKSSARIRFWEWPWRIFFFLCRSFCFPSCSWSCHLTVSPQSLVKNLCRFFSLIWWLRSSLSILSFSESDGYTWCCFRGPTMLRLGISFSLREIFLKE